MSELFATLNHAVATNDGFHSPYMLKEYYVMKGLAMAWHK
jgi:hypothetical protein